MLDLHGPKQYIFGDEFYSKSARQLRFHVFLVLHFHATKHDVTILHELDRIHKKPQIFGPIIGLQGPELKWKQIQSFL